MTDATAESKCRLRNPLSDMPRLFTPNLRAAELNPEQSALVVFRDYLIEPGQMLCFHGPLLDANRDSLRLLTEQGLLSKDKVKGGYTLTKAGFAAIQLSQGEASV
jgi:hypothetical protein